MCLVLCALQQQPLFEQVRSKAENILCLRWRLAAEDIVFSAFPLVRVWSSLLERYLTNHLWEFDQIYILTAIGDKDNWLDETKYGQKSLVQKCTFLAKAYRSTVPRRRPSSFRRWCTPSGTIVVFLWFLLTYFLVMLSAGQSGMSCCVWSGRSRSNRRSRLSGRSAKEWSSHWLTSRHLATLRLSLLFHRLTWV